ncbi:MAG: hypothetical protein ACKERG_04250 [Candidatus Hodgkinia cicadicola]
MELLCTPVWPRHHTATLDVLHTLQLTAVEAVEQTDLNVFARSSVSGRGLSERLKQSKTW